MLPNTSMNLVMVSTILLGVTVSSGAALKCYTCTDCVDGKDDAVTCAQGQDTCMKVEMSDSVTYKGCSTQDACAAGKFIQDGIGGAWDSIKGIFNNDIQDTKTGKPVECCSTSYCNTTTTIRGSPLLMLLLMGIAAIQWIKI